MARLIPVAASLLAFSTPCFAADATPDGASALQARIRQALTGFIGPAGADAAVEVSPQGDHYQVRAPGPFGLNADVRPDPDGAFTLDHIKQPSPATFAIRLPVPKDDPPPGIQVGPDGMIDLRTTVTLTDQDGHGRIDPTFQTPSHFELGAKAMNLDTASMGRTRSSRLEGWSSEVTYTPVALNRLDIAAHAEVQHYATDTSAAGLPTVRIDVQKLRVDSRLDQVSREHGPALIQATVQIFQALLATKPNTDAAPPFDPAPVRALVAALPGLANGMTIQESTDAFAVHLGDVGGAAAHAQIGFGAAAPDGIMAISLEIGMQGLTLDKVPLGPYAPFVPTQFDLRPTFSGVATADLLRVLQTSMDHPGEPPADLDKLFQHGGLKIGVDKMSFDVGPATLTATGQLVAPSAIEYTGDAEVRATGFDALLDKMKAVPAMGQVLPAMLLMKGIARSSGEQLVWAITYRDGKALVNGLDLTQMAGAGSPAPTPPPPAVTPRPGAPVRPAPGTRPPAVREGGPKR